MTFNIFDNHFSWNILYPGNAVFHSISLVHPLCYQCTICRAIVKCSALIQWFTYYLAYSYYSQPGPRRITGIVLL